MLAFSLLLQSTLKTMIIDGIFLVFSFRVPTVHFQSASYVEYQVQQYVGYKLEEIRRSSFLALFLGISCREHFFSFFEKDQLCRVTARPTGRPYRL